MAKFDVITIGGALKDFTIYTDQGKIFQTPQNLTAQRMLAFEYGAKFLAKEAYVNTGGGGANSAVSFARLGLKTAIITRLGNDEIGQEIKNKFKKEKIDTQYIQFDQSKPSGFSFILATDKKDREHLAFSCRNADEALKLTDQKLNKIDSRWFYLASLSGKDWPNNLKSIFSAADKKNIKVAWNPGNYQLQAGKRLLQTYLKLTTVLILNKDEAIELVLSGIKLGRKNPNYLNRQLYLLNILREWGPKIVVITDGIKGAWAYYGSKIYHQKIVKTKVVDTTGVGDAFGSTFIAGLIKQHFNIPKALKWGIINSASVTKEVGAQNGLLSLKKLLEKV